MSALAKTQPPSEPQPGLPASPRGAEELGERPGRQQCPEPCQLKYGARVASCTGPCQGPEASSPADLKGLVYTWHPKKKAPVSWSLSQLEASKPEPAGTYCCSRSGGAPRPAPSISSREGEILLPVPFMDPRDPQHCTARPASLEVAPPSGHYLQ